MYSNFKFQSAMAALAYSFLHSPTDAVKQIESAFLRSLLSSAAQRGCVSDRDIQDAIESSGVFDLVPEIADIVIADLWQIGDNYIGALSRQQAQELRKLRHLCLRANNGDLDAMMTIADLL